MKSRYVTSRFNRAGGSPVVSAHVNPISRCTPNSRRLDLVLPSSHASGVSFTPSPHFEAQAPGAIRLEGARRGAPVTVDGVLVVTGFGALFDAVAAHALVARGGLGRVRRRGWGSTNVAGFDLAPHRAPFAWVGRLTLFRGLQHAVSAMGSAGQPRRAAVPPGLVCTGR